MAVRMFLLLILYSTASWSADNQVKTHLKKRAASHHSFIFATVNYVWWQESVTVTAAAGQNYEMFVNAHGPCAGLGYLYRLSNWDLLFSGCAMYGSSNVGDGTNYFQKGVDTLALIAGPSVQYRAGTKVNIGLGIPAVYRTTSWELPTPAWKVEPASRISAGLLLEAQWRIRRTILQQKIGPVLGMGWQWSLGFNYIF